MMGDLITYFIEGMIIGLVGVSFVFFIAFRKSFELEKRITRFSISAISDKPISFFDNVYDRYHLALRDFSKFLSKSHFVVKYSKRYEKYLEKKTDNPIDIVATKILTALIAIIITVASDVLRRHGISGFQLVLALIVGFFIPDATLLFKYNRKQKEMENDLFKAVIIMSNAFKSGRSIMQAVKIVSEELKGPIGEEFEKVYIDLTYGLELDVVFERLSNRIKMDETKYMASSLVILNKTGGNVVKVFESIEKSFFERKKLSDELKSVTTLSNFVFRILVVIPFIIFIMIYILNPHYFSPFLASGIGKLLLALIIVIYILYIIIVKKIIKIRE